MNARSSLPRHFYYVIVYIRVFRLFTWGVHTERKIWCDPRIFLTFLCFEAILVLFMFSNFYIIHFLFLTYWALHPFERECSHFSPVLCEFIDEFIRAKPCSKTQRSWSILHHADKSTWTFFSATCIYFCHVHKILSCIMLRFGYNNVLVWYFVYINAEGAFGTFR